MQIQRKQVSLLEKQGRQQLLQFSANVSQNCHKFTIEILKLLNQFSKSENENIDHNMYLQLMNKMFKYKKIITPRQLCAKLLPSKMYAFKCFECQLQDNSIICIECFNKSNHTGHNYQKIEVMGGCCDCGDDEKWNVAGSCVDHSHKNYHVQVNQKQTQTFISQMKYVLFIVFMLTLSIEMRNYKSLYVNLAKASLIFLMKFNQESMISNEMTFQLLKSRFQQKYPHVICKNKKISLKNNSVIDFYFKLHMQKQISKMISDLCTLLFTRPEFKRFLTLFYNQALKQKPILQTSQLSAISCQIFTSHKIIGQLIQSQQFPPLQLSQIPHSTTFQKIAQIYSRYYIDLMYLAKLYNGVGQKYVDYHLNHGNMVKISGYEIYARVDPMDSSQYYGIEKIMLSYLINFLQLAKNHKEAILKSIKNIINYLNSQPSILDLSIYISKQRTLLVLLYLYFDGDLQNATRKQFLAQIQLNSQILFKILQAVLYVIRFYAVNTSNRQTVQRYYTFYSFSVGKKSRIILSIDFELLKFCLLALQNFQPLQMQNVQYNEQQSVQYEGSISFEQNTMPLKKLIALPMKFIQYLNKNTLRDDAQGAYDRKKALGVLMDYIGLLHQVILVNHSKLNMKCNLNMNDNNQLTKFYGELLKTLQNPNLNSFHDMCTTFLKEQLPNFQKFIKQNCIIENKKIRLHPSQQNNFNKLNFQYLKSKKCVESLQTLLKQTKNKCTLKQIPKSELKIQTQQILKQILFNNYFIKGIIENTKIYLQILSIHKNIKNADLPHFCLYLEQIIKLNYTLKNININNLLNNIHQSDLYGQLPQNLKKQITQMLGQDYHQVEKQEQAQKTNSMQDQKKTKMQQLKAKKHQKYKNKQFKMLNSLQNNEIDTSKSSIQKILQQQIVCMYCKLSYTQQPLYILCFTQQSNIFSNYYLDCSRNVSFVTSCGHFTHQSCHKKMNNNKSYIYCNFCKTSSNCIVQAVIQQRKQTIEFGEFDLQFDNSPQKQLMQQLQLKSKKSKQLVGIQAQNKSPTKYRKQLSQFERKVQSMATFILYGAIVDYDFFVKSLANVCCFAMGNLADQKIKINNLIQQLQQEFSDKIIEQNKMVYWNAYKFTILSIASLLCVERENTSKKWDIRQLQQNLPQNLVQNIVFILSSCRVYKGLQQLHKNKIVPYSPIKIRQLPKNLETLSKQIGSCVCCSRVTNQIAICLLCDFKSCISCEVKSLTEHTIQVHASASIFIRVDQGWPYYVAIKKNKVFNALYLNFMGSSFSLQKIAKNRDQYLLDMNAYDKIKNDLVRHRVQQQIRYFQMTTGKQSKIIP